MPGPRTSMDEAFRFGDELGPLKIVHIWRPMSGLKAVVAIDNIACGPAVGGVRMAVDVSTDRKSTRLNSKSHSFISYAVFCLKKKTKNEFFSSSSDGHTSALQSPSVRSS